MLWLRSLLAFLALPGMVGYAVPIWIGRATSRELAAPLDALSLAVQTAGTALLLACVIEFARRGRGTLAPVDPPKELVAAGLYRWVRNPMYVAVMTIVLGHALYFGSLALLGYAACLFAGFHLFVTLYEEPHLAERFGESYRRYLQSVPRWIPRRPRTAAPS
jgi:protein-S-isoprenylcysteine O-methyltransferase Ste14